MAKKSGSAPKAPAKHVADKKAAAKKAAVKKAPPKGAAGGKAAPKRAAGGKAAPKRAAGGKADEVVIRMYRQGLGDCFLLTFPPASGGKKVHVMIDCGVLQKTNDEALKLRAVVDSITRETGGEVDLLIVTHEHWDHIAGFSHAEDYFKGIPAQGAPAKLSFKRVWLSWLENLKDDLAKSIFDDLGKKKKTVAKAFGLLGQMGLRAKLGAAADDDPNARRMADDIDTSRSVLAFLGMADVGLPALAAAGKTRPPGVTGMTLGETMDWLRSLVKPGDFCKPGERRQVPGTNINTYILGPPRDEDLIKRMDVTGGEAGYHFQLAADRMALLGAIEDRESGGDGLPAAPFEPRYRLTPEEAAAAPFFREVYGFPGDPLANEAESWRRIDDEWLVSGVAQLALQIDKRVNNSSLAVAFELPDGRTMIFPGDAQFGNWFSWDDVKFKDENGKDLPITTKQILNKAVVYKVGHHGSHNATRMASLHEMTSGDLVALIPTDEQFALQQNKKNSWRMPAKELNDDLKTFTAERILRADRGKADLAAQGQLPGAAPSWSQFTDRVEFANQPLLPGLNQVQFPLYVEYRLPLVEA